MSTHLFRVMTGSRSWALSSLKSLSLFVFTSAILLTPTLSFAQGCPFSSSDVLREIERTASPYPGTTIAAIACGAAGADEYRTAIANNYSESRAEMDAFIAFEACMLLVCIPADDYSRCMGVGNELAGLVIVYDLVSRAGC